MLEEVNEPDPFEKFLMIDPPSGWHFGFPKKLPNNWKEKDFDLSKWLVEEGYPKEDLELALTYSRYFEGSYYG